MTIYNFLETNSDYLIFLCGLSFVLTAVVFFGLIKKDKHAPWVLITLFSILNALPFISQIFLPVKNSNLFIWLFSMIIAGLSGLFLFQFGIRLLYGKALKKAAILYVLYTALIIAGICLSLLWKPSVLTSFILLGAYTISFAGLLKYSSTFENTLRKILVVVAFLFFITGTCNAAYYFILEVQNDFIPGHYQPFALMYLTANVILAFVLLFFLQKFYKFFVYRSLSEQQKKWSAPGFKFIIFTLFILAVCGLLFTNNVGNNKHKTMENQLITSSRMVAGALNVENILHLTGTLQDTAIPAYNKIKDRLESIQKANPAYRFIYLTGMRDGNVFFYADNEDEGSEDYSPPGQLYPEASKEFKNIFSAGGEVIEGPETDQWGTWISSLIPVTDSAGNTIAVLGIDMDASSWENEIYQSRMMPIMIILVLFIIISVFGVVYQRSWISDMILTQSEKKYRTLFNELRDAAFVVDKKNGNISEINRQAEILLKKGSADVVNKFSFQEIIYDPDLVDITSLFMATRLNTSGTYETNIKDLQGNIIPVEFTSGEIILKGQSYYLGVFRDISDRKMANEAIMHAREEAIRANKAKSEFLANMSHEIRTPLNGVIGFTDLLMTTQLNKLQKEYLTHIKYSGYTLLDIINNILDFSKIEAGKIELEKADFNFRALIENTVKMISGKTAEKGLELMCRIDANVPEFIIGDQVRIRQILVNFLGNAVKFTEHGEIFVSVSLPDNENLHISVSDTGIGISKEKLDLVFERFTQADASTTRKFSGTGLGLTISKGLSELMGGKIIAESEPGEGSTFTFVFPLIRSEMVSEEQTARISFKNVLIVDDNPTNLLIISEMFKLWGINPECFDNGKDAIKFLEENPKYDLLLLDMQMPEMDGIDVTRKIKSTIPPEKQPEIIMLSSIDIDKLRILAKELKINNYLLKPVSMSQLYDAVQNISYDKYQTVVSMNDAVQKEVITDKATKINPFTDKTILVAEDNRVNILVIKKRLEDMGFNVLVAIDGNEAIKLVSTHKVDMILMDVHMPDLNGYEATQKIRENERTKDTHIPIIALTADAMKGDMEKCIASGMDDYLAKPFRPEELEEKIAKYIRF